MKKMESLSPNARNVTVCPFCKELIPKGAMVCSHCHSMVKIPPHKKKRPFVLNNFMLGVYAATIFWLYIIFTFFRK